jgi:hypothetical protein
LGAMADHKDALRLVRGNVLPAQELRVLVLARTLQYPGPAVGLHLGDAAGEFGAGAERLVPIRLAFEQRGVRLLRGSGTWIT